jgi:Family of unknown function (DUF6334)
MSFEQLGHRLSSTLALLQALEGQTLQAVRQRHADASLQRLTLVFDSQTLLIDAKAEDDTIEAALLAGSVFDASDTDVSTERPWNEFRGNPFGWGWVAVNQQGYFDAIFLSFGPGVPQIALVVVASSIKVGTYAAVDDPRVTRGGH